MHYSSWEAESYQKNLVLDVPLYQMRFISNPDSTGPAGEDGENPAAEAEIVCSVRQNDRTWNPSLDRGRQATEEEEGDVERGLRLLLIYRPGPSPHLMRTAPRLVSLSIFSLYLFRKK